VPIVSSSGPSGWHNEAKVRAPGVVTGRYGTIGQVFLVDRDFWPLNTALYVRDFKGSDPRFVAYFLRSIRWEQYTDKAAVPGVNRNHVHMEQVAWPPPAEQRRIGAVLGALDDKIELNRKMNRTLEAMAQAIFKSWFIDFDGHDDLVDSELGPIPRGWRVGVLADLLVLQRGFDLPQRSRTPGHVSILSAGGASGTHDTARVSGPGVVTGRSGKLGDVFLVLDDFWPLNTTLWVKDYRTVGPYHAYQLLRTLDLARFNAGSAVPTLNRNHVHGLPLAIPPKGRVDEYETLCAKLFARVQVNERESAILAELRDALLPKLISGEIRVPEAEDLVEAAP
jgi:type I restriction enzyme S subunit